MLLLEISILSLLHPWLQGYDLYYIENWSLTFDVKILLMTVRAALRFREVH